MAAKLDLVLDRSFQNAIFENWKLGDSSFLQSFRAAGLPGGVAVVENAATDYVHTRASVLRNHLIHSQGRLFIFIRAAISSAQPALVLVELVPDAAVALGLATCHVCGEC